VINRPEVSPEIVAKLASICLALPEVQQEPAWVGTRWCIRKKNFAHVVGIDAGWPPAYAQAAGAPGPMTVLTFRVPVSRLDTPRFDLPPFFRPVWFPNIVGVALGGRRLGRHRGPRHRQLLPPGAEEAGQPGRRAGSLNRFSPRRRLRRAADRSARRDSPRR
jgi:hypothetical protein